MIGPFQTFIASEKLCAPNDRILVALSGGADSIVLLDLFRKAGYRLVIAHVNFNLRGAESDGDEQFVKALGHRLQIKTFTRSFDTLAHAEKKKMSVQEAARELRYNWFNELAESEPVDKIALAHHQDDLIETFFINLLRGSGIRGLKSIPVKRDNIIRPLMFAGRKDILEYCRVNHLSYRTDSSNESDKYLRNAIRSRLIPLLEELRPGASRDALLMSIGHLSEDYAVFRRLIDDMRDRLVGSGDQVTFDINESRQLGEALFYQMLSPYHFDRQVTDDILHGLSANSTGKMFHSSTHRLVIDRERIVISGKEAGDQEEALIGKNLLDMPGPVPLKFTKHANHPGFPFEKDPDHAYFDLKKISFPLKVRPWKKGDRITPFGMEGSKLVSDLLIDEKLNRFEKEKIWVMESSGIIIWVIGLRASNLTRVDGDTIEILEVSLAI